MSWGGRRVREEDGPGRMGWRGGGAKKKGSWEAQEEGCPGGGELAQQRHFKQKDSGIKRGNYTLGVNWPRTTPAWPVEAPAVPVCPPLHEGSWRAGLCSPFHCLGPGKSWHGTPADTCLLKEGSLREGDVPLHLAPAMAAHGGPRNRCHHPGQSQPGPGPRKVGPGVRSNSRACS